MNKVVFENVLENKELGKVLDARNFEYEFKYYANGDGTYRRLDCQLDEIEDGHSLADIISSYIDIIENRIYNGCDEEVTTSHLESDLEILKNGLEKLEV